MSQADDILKNKDDLFINMLNTQKTFNTDYPSLKNDTKITIKNTKDKSKVTNPDKSKATNPNKQNEDNELIKFRKQHSTSLRTIHKSFKGIDDNLKIVKNLSLLAVAGLSVMALKLSDIVAGRALNAQYAGMEESFVTDDSYSGLSTGKMSEEGKARLVSDEGGYVLNAYKDSKGVWTIGAGHTGTVDGVKVGPGMHITKEKAEQLVENDLKVAEKKVNDAVKVPISQRWFDALVNFTYINGHLKGTKLLSAVNNKDWITARKELSIEPQHEKRMQRWRDYVSQDMTETGTIKSGVTPAQKPVEKVSETSSGGIIKVKKDEKIGGYYAPYDITLSARAQKYIEDTKGTGYITSGTNGKSHAKTGVGGITHDSGNKIDVQGFKGRYTSNEDFAKLCINFLKNPNTAYINLESFSTNDVKEVLQYIETHDAEAYKLAFKPTPYTPSKGGTWFNNYHLLCAVRTSHSKHLDIGIIPNAYNNKTDEYSIQNKKAEEAKSNVKQAKLPKDETDKQDQPNQKNNKIAKNKTNLFIKENNKFAYAIPEMSSFANIKRNTDYQEDKDRISSIV